MISVRLTNGNSEVIIADREGRAIRFQEEKVRNMGRMSTGVRAMTLADDDDEVIGMITMNGTRDGGFGKRLRKTLRT